MASESLIRKYRDRYAKLLRLYPKPYRERFGEAMEQTFNDLCRERATAEGGLFRFALWTFFETSAAIIREHATAILRFSMKRGLTIFLRIVISLIAIAALAVCILALPPMVVKEAAKTPKTAYLIYLFLVGAYILSIPFFVALYQAFKLLTYVDRDNGFSESSVRALGLIKYCAVTIGILMVAGIAAVMAFSFGKGEDIAGIVAMGLLVTFASSVVAAVAAVLQKQVEKAIDIKSERLL
jgi:hypothetical protein